MTSSRRNCVYAVVILLLFLGAFVPTTTFAQELAWRADYNAARKESADKNRPMFLDFVTDNCFWCKKLESTSFREASVATLLNDRFVLLKVDAEQNPQLAQALRIQSYPTLIIAAADGRILTIIEGYVEAPKLLEQLQKAVRHHAPEPDWMARDFQIAENALKQGDYVRTLTHLRTILADKQERPTQEKARLMLAGIEQQAAGQFAAARSLEDKGQLLDAADAFAEILRRFNGASASIEAADRQSKLLARADVKTLQRVRRARELLAQVREDLKLEHYLAALERCEHIAAHFTDLPQGADAARLAATIRDNPEHLAKACAQLSERQGQLYLSLAESWSKKGNADQAALVLERVQREFPGTAHAQVAEVKLKELNGRPMVQTDFKKQP